MFCALIGHDIRWAFTGPLVLLLVILYIRMSRLSTCRCSRVQQFRWCGTRCVLVVMSSPVRCPALYSFKFYMRVQHC